MLYPLSYTGVIPVAGFEPATTRVRCEATLVFTTGRISRYRLPLFSPGNARKEFEADLFRYLLLRGYAPVPETQQLGEGAAPYILYGQGTAGHGRACAQRTRTSQLTYVSCSPKKYP